MTSGPKTNLPVAPPTGSRTPRAALRRSCHRTRRLRARVGRTRHDPRSGQTLQSAFIGLFQGTPGRMRLLGILGVIAALLLGGGAANAILASEAAAERAANTTEQVVRMQSIQVDLLRADALATNAFLVGGLETADARAQYDAAMAAVARNIAAGSAAQPADAKALGTLAEKVQDYGALVEQARSNNRLGLPRRARYLTEASSSLRASAIPVVAQIVEANEARAQKEFDRSNSSLQLVAGVAALIILVLIAVWLARRTRRYTNPSLTEGAARGGPLRRRDDDRQHRHDNGAGGFRGVRDAVNLAHVRTAANDARANESLTLIQRGSGARYQDAWKANDTTVRETLNQVEGASDLTSGAGTRTPRRTSRSALATMADSGSRPSSSRPRRRRAARPRLQRLRPAGDAGARRRQHEGHRPARGPGRRQHCWAVLIAILSLIASWLIVRGIGQRIKEYR